MKNVFLALRPNDDSHSVSDDRSGIVILSGNYQNKHKGLCQAVFIADSNLIGQYLEAGWYVYRLYGMQKVVEATLELKMEKKDVECSESTKSDNECGR